MDTYTGKVIPSSVADFPFLAVVYDTVGSVIAEFPVRTEADGAAKISEALNDLENQPSSSVLD